MRSVLSLCFHLALVVTLAPGVPHLADGRVIDPEPELKLALQPDPKSAPQLDSNPELKPTPQPDPKPQPELSKPES
uniref:Uncharacterized protein n=1 Tax=Arundo donax TaxID=35708 RepID=A0A0A9J278_ARUDO